MKKQVKILIAGDLCMQDRTACVDFDTLLQIHQSCVPIIKSADYALVNLECAVAEKEVTPIKKAGIALRNSTKVLDFLQYIGFDAVTLANNHFADYGDRGVVYSLQELKKRNIDYVGGGHDIKEASKVLIKRIGERRVAFINACEHEFTIATEKKAGCNPLNPISLYYDILNAKQQSDNVIVIIHGGHEHYQLPTPRMQEMYRFFIDVGADVVVNHHQHCYSGYEIYAGHPIFYGLGNFSFDENGQRNCSWNEGYLLNLLIGETISFELIPYRQNDKDMGVYLQSEDERAQFEHRIEELNVIIASPSKLRECAARMMEKRRREYMEPLAPYQYPRLLKIAQYHLIPSKLAAKLLPNYMTEERMLMLKSYFQCESHVEVMNKLLEND